MIENRKAYHDYSIKDTLECGIALRGNEVKSIRKGSVNLKDSWCTIQNGNLVVRGMQISKWDTANMFDIDENRERQLLVHKRELQKLKDIIKIDGMAFIPLSLYFSNGRVKLKVGICQGLHHYDKRNKLKEKQQKRDIERAMKKGD